MTAYSPVTGRSFPLAPDALQPFVRKGRAVPLTCGDYADATRTGRFKAQHALKELYLQKLVKVDLSDDQMTYIYELSDKGRQCFPELSADVPPALYNARLVAVAKRAFGGAIDVRPLLPQYEAAIGEMMSREVPKEFRPVVPMRRVPFWSEEQA